MENKYQKNYETPKHKPAFGKSFFALIAIVIALGAALYTHGYRKEIGATLGKISLNIIKFMFGEVKNPLVIDVKHRKVLSVGPEMEDGFADKAKFIYSIQGEGCEDGTLKHSNGTVSLKCATVRLSTIIKGEPGTRKSFSIDNEKDKKMLTIQIDGWNGICWEDPNKSEVICALLSSEESTYEKASRIPDGYVRVDRHVPYRQGQEPASVVTPGFDEENTSQPKGGETWGPISVVVKTDWPECGKDEEACPKEEDINGKPLNATATATVVTR